MPILLFLVAVFNICLFGLNLHVYLQAAALWNMFGMCVSLPAGIFVLVISVLSMVD